MKKTTCDLCGLSLDHGVVVLKESDHVLKFCCYGCRQVYKMLWAASDDPDPASFKQTDIYKRCVSAGIIPQSEDDLKNRSQKENAVTAHPQTSDTNAGFDPKPAEEDNQLPLDLNVSGMWCPACAWAIEETLSRKPGVLKARCQFTTDRIKISYNPILTTPQDIMALIEKLGYHSKRSDEQKTGSVYRREFIRLAISIFLTMNVMMLSSALYTGFFTQLSEATIHNLTWPIAIMSCVVFIYGGKPIHQRAVSGLRGASPGMETLISIGASSAFFYSFYNWLTGSIHLYFDTASMLITLVLIGKTVEQRTKDRISEQIGSFFEIQPLKIRLWSPAIPGGRYTDIKTLSRGDVFLVEEGEIVPADGKVLEGEASIDESTLTGEAKPITKKRGDVVSSGTKVKSGSLKVSARSIGKESLVGQLIEVMEDALNQKSKMEDITDKMLKVFVPLIIVLAIATGIVCLLVGLNAQEAIIRAVTVLVISCPCALGVAIPLARVAGISLAGKKGILIHQFSAFEKIKEIDTIVFDKTGTLTTGKWQLTRIEPLNEWTTDTILAMAAGLEAYSTHFAAEAIVQTAQEKKIQPAQADQVEEENNGISGLVNGAHIKIGSIDFMDINWGDGKKDPAADKTDSPFVGSVIYMTADGKPCARLYFGDTIRQSSTIISEHLKNKGIKLALISGDGQQTTQIVGNVVGISDCHGGLSPQDKAGFVNRLKHQGAMVAMMGDGINDVPALASSDLGIAVHSDHRIGKEASSITLMGNDPGQLLSFYWLARRVSGTIRQNLIFTFIYNLISIPIAMSGLLNPLVAVSAMLMSSLSVTGNTLLLARRVSAQKDLIDIH